MAGYVNVNISETVTIDLDEVISDIDDDDLINEIKSRKLDSEFKTGLKNSNNDPFTHKNMCDFFGVNYHTPIKKITKLLSEKLHMETRNILK